MKVQLILTLLIVISTTMAITAQQSILDSLEIRYTQTKSIKEKTRLLDEMRENAYSVNPNLAIFYSNRLIELGSLKNNIRTKALGLYGLGFSFYKKELSDSSEVYFIEALKLFKKIRDNDNIIKTLGTYSGIFQQRNMPAKQLELQIQALNYIKDNTPSNIKLTIYRYLMLSYFNKRLHQQALEYALKVLELTDLNKNDRQQHYILWYIGNIYYEQDNVDKAIEYFQQHSEVARKHNDFQSLCFSLGNISTTLGQLGQYKKAINTAKKALQIAKNIKDTNLTLNAQMNIVINLLELEEIDSTEQYIYSMNFVDTNALPILQLQNYYAMWTKFFLLKKDYNLALNYGKKYLFKANENKLFFSQRSANQYMEQIYEGLGDYKKSLTHCRAAQIANDSLVNEENIETMTTLRLEYDFEQKQKEQSAIVKAKQRRQNLFIWIAGILAFFLGIVVFLIYRNNQNIRKSKQIIEEQNDELTALYNHKNQLFANISHELQTPLTLILSALRPMKGLESLKTHVNSLQQVIRQVLDLAKTEQSQLVIVGNQFLLNDLIDYLKIEFRSIARYRNIQFNIHSIVEDDFKLKTDGQKLLTVVKNLLSNAFKFTPSGGSVSVNISKNKDNQVIIRVQDSGKGISEKDLPLIFNRYFQTTQEKAIVEGGMGIGLAISREYIQLLGGTIQVKSTKDKGSIFTIQFPAKLDNLEIDELSSQAFNEYLGSITANDESIFNSTITPIPKVPDNTAERATIYNNIPLLVIEDNISMCQHLNTVLSPQYNVTFAPHGKKALELLAQDYQPQLIISDLMMPEMDGFKFVQHIKNLSTLKDIPVLMLTAREGIEDKIDAFRVGVDDYLTKPFVKEELHAHINLLINNYQERKDYKEELTQANPPKEIKENKLIQNSDTLPEEDRQWLDEFNQVVLQNINNRDFSVHSVATEMAFSYSHIFREVKRLTGFTPYQYIKEVRLREAKKMLESKRYRTVKAVVYRVGQTDVRHFSGSFKKRFGKTPIEYLRD